MKTIKEGDTVYILYEAKSEDGKEIYYKNEKDSPLELVVGEGKFFPVIENELKNMKVGDSKTITLQPKDAFGPRLDELIFEVPKNAIRADVELSVGSRVKINAPSGKVFYGTVTDIKENTLTIDLNHPLAGKTLVFTITVVSIK
ncbi:MAG: peptidylprolyl isomerase [Thermoplasmata archaeon]|nr:peptidylprolyl isomerase [Thermoplasmata archaeon]